MENFAALIAIDWADKKHAVSLYDETTGGREQTTIKHTPEALNDWRSVCVPAFRDNPLLTHADYAWFSALPASDTVYAARLTAAMGSDRSRWQTADDLLRFSGLAPVIERSGKQNWMRCDHRRLSSQFESLRRAVV